MTPRVPAPVARREAWQHSPAARAGLALGLALLCAGGLIALAGGRPGAALAAFARGAFGSSDRLAFALNRAAPYILAAVGIALCFRARIITIGAEGQIALGGLGAAWATLGQPQAGHTVAVLLGLGGGLLFGAAWSLLAALIHLARGINEVVVTLLMNFIALFLVEIALHGPLGEPGAGFLQSPLLPDNATLPMLAPGPGLHGGILLAVVVALAAQLLLWRTRWGFAVRVFGESRAAAAYGGFSRIRITLGLMGAAGALAGLAGAIEVMGVQDRVIDGFSRGFGFNAIAVALLATLEPWALIPAGLFFAFLETGTAAMQREVAIPSSLVTVTEGLTMLFVLGAAASRTRRPA